MSEVKRRDVVEVIDKIINLLPTEEISLLDDIRYIRRNAAYQPPESRAVWVQVQDFIDSFGYDPDQLADYQKAIINAWTDQEVFTLNTEGTEL